MEITLVPEIPYDDARKLREAGTATVAALAAVTDAADLAARAGLPPEAVESYRAAARGHLERLMAEAGIRDESDLARADPRALAEATGLSVEDVESYQGAARAVLARQAAPVPEAGADRVVLLDGVPTARVVVQGRVLEAVPIVTGRFVEDAEDALGRAGEQGAFLTEGAITATVRVEGRNVPGLPVYKAGPEGNEVRVRIKEIRVKGAPPPEPAAEPQPAKKGFFGKLLKR